MAEGLEFLAYDPEAHGAFVAGTFRASLQDNLPWSLGDVKPHRVTLTHVLRSPKAQALVAVPKGHPDDLLGWAAAYDGALVFAYVRHIVRKRGIATALMEALGLRDERFAIPVVFWTRACSRIAADGRALFFDTDTLEAISAMAKKKGDRACESRT